VSTVAIQRALETDRVVDITTTGRRSGDRHRIEIWFHYLDVDLYLTGLPGTRGWYANLLVNPDFTFHLKQSVQADLPARATPITEERERRKALTRILERDVVAKERGLDRLDDWVARSPLVSVELELPST
jgi:hypothetical protein